MRFYSLSPSQDFDHDIEDVMVRFTDHGDNFHGRKEYLSFRINQRTQLKYLRAMSFYLHWKLSWCVFAACFSY
jgi:hypothetical protein